MTQTKCVVSLPKGYVVYVGPHAMCLIKKCYLVGLFTDKYDDYSIEDIIDSDIERWKFREVGKLFYRKVSI